MKIALFGYGKMGKEIEQIALQRGHEIVLKIDKDNVTHISNEALKEADIAIEFSTPQTVVENIYRCFDASIPVVVGSTGWYEQFDPVKEKCLKGNHALFYATNFSLGVNLFFKMNEYMARLMSSFQDYEAFMQEIHHIHKLDKPSGTAITAAEGILHNYPLKKNWTIEKGGSPESLYIDVIREDEVPGTHTVFYQSGVDEISLTHKAFNRKGFAMGAVLASEFLKNKKGIFNMADLLK